MVQQPSKGLGGDLEQAIYDAIMFMRDDCFWPAAIVPAMGLQVADSMTHALGTAMTDQHLKSDGGHVNIGGWC